MINRCMYILKLIALLLISVHLAACIPVIKPDEAGQQVKLVFIKQEINESLVKSFDKNCKLLGEVVGSEGHWYTYLFIANEDLTSGALNDLRNKAAGMGANTVVVHQNLYFATSVTFLGDAYQCQLPAQ